jgi:enoyl-CoA hydratase/carnithine racemase
MKNSLINILNQDNGILRLTLDDENNKNALSEAMIDELTEAINAANDNKEVKVIIIASNGNVFCSGHNLKEITAARNNNDKGKSYFMNLFELCSSLMQLIVSCSKPVIAEVDGIATAAGCQLVASCDLAISSNTAKFATPGVNIGLFCSTPMVALSRNVSKKEAMKMLLTGDMIDAVEAKRISLINDYVSDDKLEESVNNLALKISKKSSMTVKIGKEAFYKQAEMSLSDAYAYTSVVMAQNTLNDDAKEGISSFIEKRDPNWQDN